MKNLLDELALKHQKIVLGGGEKKIAAHKKKGKMTAWERVHFLLDPQRPYTEIGMFAGEGMYEAEGGCPNGGVVCVMGYVAGKLCVVVSNDATVKAGAWFPITAKKNLRAQEIAMKIGFPLFI